MDQYFYPHSVKQRELPELYSLHIYSLVQGRAVLPYFVDVSIISVFFESEVRSGWTEPSAGVDLR